MKYFYSLLFLISTNLYATTLFITEMNDLSESGLGAELALIKNKTNCDIKTVYYGETGVVKENYRFNSKQLFWSLHNQYLYETGSYDINMIKNLKEDGIVSANTNTSSNKLILNHSEFKKDTKQLTKYKRYIPVYILKKCE